MKGIDDMGLIVEQIKIKWHGNIRRHFESLGYIYTKKGEEFSIWSNELPKNSHIKIRYVCDNCKQIFSRSFQDYNKITKEDKKTFCNKCAVKLFTSEKLKKTKFKLSFAQWLIETYGNNALELYWDYEKNTENPWNIGYGSNEKVWIKCQEKDYHESYEITCKNFTLRKSRCPYCNKNSGKVHPLDSLKQDIINSYGEEFFNSIWSDKNNIDPTTIAPNSKLKCWWNCPDGKHEPFERSCNNSYTCEFRCPNCVEEKEESILEEKTRLYLEDLGYEVKTEYDTLRVINPKTKQTLPFDNEIVLNNGKHLIIEVHGEQHYNIHFYESKCNLSKKESNKKLYERKLYDRYKRIKCIQAGYYYLELSYKTFNKKETYKSLIDNKIKEILEK